MLKFKVRCFLHGVWDGKDEREVTASDCAEAAKKVCGEGLVERGSISKLRAKVRVFGQRHRIKTSFFER